LGPKLNLSNFDKTKFCFVVMVIVAAGVPMLLGHPWEWSAGLLGLGLFLYVFAFQEAEQANSSRKPEDLDERTSRLYRLAELGELSAGIGHEVKNCVAIIHGQADLLSHEISGQLHLDEVKVKNRVNKIRAASDRANQVINSLMKLSTLSGKGGIETSLRDIIVDATNICSDLLRSEGIDLRVDLPDEDVFVSCNRIELSQVLINLLSNSSHALRGVSEKWISLGVVCRNEGLEISVMDSGSGIAPHIRQHIMDSFFTTKVLGEGTGLGLSVSKEIVERHGGDFYLDENSSNTRFVIKLPSAVYRLSSVA
jgi:signal transduction histidine kinase